MEVFRLTRATLDDEMVIDSILSSLDISQGSSQASKFIKQLRESCTGELFSLSNRRLFVARVIRNFGLLDKVLVQEYDFGSERVQRPERGEEDGDEKAKWLSALSTENMGRSVTEDLKCTGMLLTPLSFRKQYQRRPEQPSGGLSVPKSKIRQL
jgi:hypothetical protein